MSGLAEKLDYQQFRQLMEANNGDCLQHPDYRADIPIYEE